MSKTKNLPQREVSARFLMLAYHVDKHHVVQKGQCITLPHHLVVRMSLKE